MSTIPGVIIVDIDNTILDPSRRKAAAFIDATKSSGTMLDDVTIDSIEKAATKSYDFHPMKRIVDKKLDNEIFKRFLNNDYLVMNGEYLDKPLKGSIRFLNDAVKSGCNIVYLTGRSTEGKNPGKFPGMVPGTLETIAHYGYPVPSYPGTPVDPVRVVFKDKKKRMDEEFKITEIEKMMRERDIIAIFDDKKSIIDGFKKSFPGITRIAVLMYPDQEKNDYGCVPATRKGIGEGPVRGGTECIVDFSRVGVLPGCKITINGKLVA